MHYLRLKKLENIRKSTKYKLDGVGFRKEHMMSCNLLKLPSMSTLFDFNRNIFCIDKHGTGLCFAQMKDGFILYNFSGLAQIQRKLAQGDLEGSFSANVRKFDKNLKEVEADDKPGDEFRNMMVQGLMMVGGVSNNLQHFKKKSSDYYGSKVYVFDPRT